jgi:hypothetical protein
MNVQMSNCTEQKSVNFSFFHFFAEPDVLVSGNPNQATYLFKEIKRE